MVLSEQYAKKLIFYSLRTGSYQKKMQPPKLCTCHWNLEVTFGNRTFFPKLQHLWNFCILSFFWTMLDTVSVDTLELFSNWWKLGYARWISTAVLVWSSFVFKVDSIGVSSDTLIQMVYLICFVEIWAMEDWMLLFWWYGTCFCFIPNTIILKAIPA